MTGFASDDRYDLQRFVSAQESVLAQVRPQLKNGRKSGHWMWFMFPQIKGLGSSDLARKFAISSLEEAKAYIAHPMLGARLRELTELVNLIQHRSAEEIFGDIDALKFRSCMTLFSQATSENDIFLTALQRYFAGELDRLTLDRI